MKSFTTIVITVTCLSFIGDLDAKYLLVEVYGIGDNKEPMMKEGILKAFIKLFSFVGYMLSMVNMCTTECLSCFNFRKTNSAWESMCSNSYR